MSNALLPSSCPEGRHWSDDSPFMISEGKYSTPIFRNSTPTREVYYAPLYFVVASNLWLVGMLS